MPPGRDQRGPIERLVRIVATLQAAGQVGVAGEQLVRVAGFDGDGAADQLTREIKNLRKLGWQIDNIAEQGEAARYRMRNVDNRLSVALSPDQLRALRRAALLARRADLAERLDLPDDTTAGTAHADISLSGHGPRLADVLAAVRERRMLLFRYNGKPREAHPHALTRRNHAWYLDAREVDSDQIKKFVVARMSHLDVMDRDTSEATKSVPHGGLHPMTFLEHDPIDIVVVCPSQFAADVIRLLNPPGSLEDDGETARLSYSVTNRNALRTRLLELGPRVTRVEGFDDHLLQLRAVVEGGAV